MDILYKRTKSGKIQYWKIKVGEANVPYIRKESGQLGTTNPLTHLEHITEGKNIGKTNETTPMEQAISQAQSDWNKKRDEGYKSLADLGDWQDEEALEIWLDKTLPQENTDASGNTKPMLATDWKKIKKIEYPVFVQPKLDGVRCLIIVATAGITRSIRFLSRSGKDYDFPHLLGATFPDGEFILDGEIYSDDLTFQQIVAATKKVTEHTHQLHFRCYDIINHHPQKVRSEMVVDAISSINAASTYSSPYFHVVPTWTAQNEKEVKAYHDSFIEQGYEGAMIRYMGGKYAAGARSRELLKVKEFDETEYKFMFWEYGQREEDLIAVCSSPSGEFRAKMVGTKAEKVEIAKHPSHTGMITIKHFGLTEDGLPRFPIGKSFRDE